VSELDTFEVLSVISQRPFLFNMPIMNNIILGEKLDINRYNEILLLLNFSEYFTKEQLETDITENGNSLSGGQIKLISLARALYRGSSVLIMDELCANLDKKAIDNIKALIIKLKETHILILVEHVDSLDHLADKVITLKGSNIIDVQ